MISLMMMAAILATESTQQGWIHQLRQADRLIAEKRYGEAEAAYIAARKEASKLGADPAAVAITLNHMGHYYQTVGRLREASTLHAAAFAIAERTFGAATENGVKLAIDLSMVYLELDQFSQAESVIRRVLRRSDSLSAVYRAILLSELASVLACKRKFPEAEALYLDALPVFERDPRPEFRERTIIALSNLSTIYMQMNRYAEGLMYSESALAQLRAMSDPPFILAFKTTANAAAVAAKVGKTEEADFLFKSAITFCENTLGRDHYLLGNVMENYAEFLRQAGRRADARTAKKRAKAILDRFGKENLVGLAVEATAFR